MKLPDSLMNSLTDLEGFDKDAFEKIHASGEQITSVRLNPAKVESPAGGGSLLDNASPVPWSSTGYYLASRPSFTFDPLFHAGCYYVQEASSMFLEQAVRQLADLSSPLKVLDLSAAPGGKSTHLQSLLPQGSLLVSNEVIRSRAGILKENIIKWGASNVVVTNNDPADFNRLSAYFDMVVIDAPCSGSGLFRREPEAIAEWSLNNVALCSQRQQRIIADVWSSLKPGGVLIYSTCSYSREEDEDIMDWLAREFAVQNKRLAIAPEWRITETVTAQGNYGYRFWPDKVKGEGFFIACFQKNEETNASLPKVKTKATPVTKNELGILAKWVNTDGFRFIKNDNTVYAWPEDTGDDMQITLSSLKVIYSGVRIGELMKDKIVPDHALAMSHIVRDDIPGLEVSYENAIRYLQRKDMQLTGAEKGWQLITFRGYPLGWVNVLSNRINNYYPKELRILKDSN